MSRIVLKTLGVAVLGTKTPILARNEPAEVVTHYEVRETETWIDRELPILEYADTGEEFKTGTRIVLLYRHDCPDCRRAIPQYEQMAHSLSRKEVTSMRAA